MNKTFPITFIALAIFFFSSCKNSVELVKRHYKPGYYIAVNKSKEKTKSQDLENPKEKAEKMVAINSMALKEDNKQEAVLKGNIHYTTNSSSEKFASKTERGSNIITSTGGKESINESPAANYSSKQNTTSNGSTPADSDVMLVLLVLLAIFIPPLAVYLKDESLDKWFWVTLLLCIFSSIFWWGPLGLGYLGWLWLAAVIIALLKVFDKL